MCCHGESPYVPCAILTSPCWLLCAGGWWWCLRSGVPWRRRNERAACLSTCRKLNRMKIDRSRGGSTRVRNVNASGVDLQSFGVCGLAWALFYGGQCSGCFISTSAQCEIYPMFFHIHSAAGLYTSLHSCSQSLMEKLALEQLCHDCDGCQGLVTSQI